MSGKDTVYVLRVARSALSDAKDLIMEVHGTCPECDGMTCGESYALFTIGCALRDLDEILEPKRNTK